MQWSGSDTVQALFCTGMSPIWKWIGALAIWVLADFMSSWYSGVLSFLSSKVLDSTSASSSIDSTSFLFRGMNISFSKHSPGPRTRAYHLLRIAYSSPPRKRSPQSYSSLFDNTRIECERNVAVNSSQKVSPQRNNFQEIGWKITWKSFYTPSHSWTK